MGKTSIISITYLTLRTCTICKIKPYFTGLYFTNLKQTTCLLKT